MADNVKYVQAQPFQLAGAGATQGATSITLQTFAGIDGTLLTMTDFGTKGFMTMEPGSSAQEEAITFTGVTQNANGTATLTGISTVLFVAPYTETSGLSKSHAGGTSLIITNSAAFYNTFVNKADDETITGHWTFDDTPTITNQPVLNTDAANKEYVDNVAVSGAPDANTTTKGIVQEATQAQVDAKTQVGSTGAELFINPSNLRATKYFDYAADAGSTDAYAITVTPSISSYVTGYVFTFKANTANTGNATLNVNSIGALNILKNHDQTLVDGDIEAGQDVMVIYDGTQFQMLSQVAASYASIRQLQDSSTIYAASSGGTDTYAISLTPTLPAYVTGQVFNFSADVRNTGACSLNVNTLGAKTIKKNVSEDLRDYDIRAGQIVTVVYDGTNFQMISQRSNVGNLVASSGSSTTVNNTTSESDLLSVTVPGLSMGTTGSLRIRGQILVSSAATSTNSIRVKYGGTTVAQGDYTASANTTLPNLPGWFDAVITNTATNAQVGGVAVVFGTPGINVGGISASATLTTGFTAGNGSSAIDSTADQTLKVTIQFGTASSDVGITLLNYVVERVS